LIEVRGVLDDEWQGKATIFGQGADRFEEMDRFCFKIGSKAGTLISDL